jgi:membrane protease YdiL (CAAX protease family)
MNNVLQKIKLPESAPIWSLISAGVFVIGYIIVWIAAQALAVAITGSDLSQPSNGAQALGALISSVLMAIVIVQWVRPRAAKLPGGWRDALHMETSHTLPLFVCILLGLASAWAIDLIGVLLKLKGIQVVPPSLGSLVGPVTVSWVVAAVVALLALPIGEELLLRGLLYPALADRVGNLAAIALTSLIGMLLAILLAGPLPWYAIIQPLLMGLVLTTLRAHTKSTQMAIVARTMFGLFFVLSALISARF